MIINMAFSTTAEGTYTFNDFDVQASYNKYGSQRVLNWVDGVRPQSTIGAFGVMYYNTERRLITLALYELPNSLSSRTTQNFKSSINQTSTDFNSFQAMLFRPPSSQEGRLVASGFSRTGETNTTLFNLSSRAYLQLNYGKAGDFDKITVSAFNDYSIASHNVAI